MQEAIKEGSGNRPPEICQREDLSKRAEEILGCADEIEVLAMQMPTDILETPEGEDFFQSAAALVASLQKKAAIIRRDIVPGKKD